MNCLGINLIKRSGRPRWQKPETRAWEVKQDLSEGGDLVLGGQSRRHRVSFLSPPTWTSCPVPATVPAGSFVEMKEPILTFSWKGQRGKPDVTILKRRDQAGGIPRVQSRGNGGSLCGIRGRTGSQIRGTPQTAQKMWSADCDGGAKASRGGRTM